MFAVSQYAALPLAPPDFCLPTDFHHVDSSYDLLPLLVKSWRFHGEKATCNRVRKSITRVIARLEQQQAEGAKLTLGIPGVNSSTLVNWLGVRLAWWPQGIPDGRRIGMASSRLGRHLDRQSAWFTVLRSACQKIEPASSLLLTAASSTTERYVTRAAQLFGLRVLRVHTPVNNTLKKWGRIVLAAPRKHPNRSAIELFLSPPIPAFDPVADNRLRLPEQDRAVLALSDSLFVVRVRRKGHWHQLIRDRLAEGTRPAASIYVAIGPQLLERTLVDEFLDAGAVGWIVPDVLHACGDGSVVRDRASASTGDSAPIVSVPPSCEWNYLSHSTRRQFGARSDQTETEFLDELILSPGQADHSALATLLRIVKTKRLIASPLAIRGNSRVVSFTSVPLENLPGLRVFRPHRGRWDFEPYGLCIRRDWLEHRGTRAVRYGNERLWSTLAKEDRPFFQRKLSQFSNHEPIDWQVEQEFRHVGDVNLESLPADAALVFVPTIEEARQLANASPWPVTVLPVTAAGRS